MSHKVFRSLVMQCFLLTAPNSSVEKKREIKRLQLLNKFQSGEREKCWMSIKIEENKKYWDGGRGLSFKRFKSWF